MVLSVGLVLANYGGGVTPATAADITKDNHTLRWDTNNPSDTRFITAFPGAVLDKNTGLVWEQAPDATPREWGEATRYCLNKIVQPPLSRLPGTVGWRLPSVVELRSLQDPSLAGPFVPTSVFTGVQLSDYWSATTFAEFPTTAWQVSFGAGGVLSDVKNSEGSVWCVRGGMNADAY
jgi:hypothetical protein